MTNDRQGLSTREGLLDQLAYLLIELDALNPLLSSLPPGMLTVELPESGSVLGALSEMAHLDANVHLPALRNESVSAADLDRELDINDASLSELIDSVRVARSRVIDAFTSLDNAGWSRTLTIDEYRPTARELALAIVRRDATVLMALSDNLRHGRLFADA